MDALCLMMPPIAAATSRTCARLPVGAYAMVEVIADHRRDDAGRTVGRSGHDASPGSIFLVDRHGVDAQPVHHPVRLEAVGALFGEELLVNVTRPPPHLQATGQGAVQGQAAVHAGVHRGPDPIQFGIQV
jgi:hypothetical protein